MILISQAVYADSSWIWLIPHTGKFIKTAVVVIIANAVSFLLAYALLLGHTIYPKFNDVLNSGAYYIVGAELVILTLAIEMPIVYNLLKKEVSSKKKLIWSIIGSNIVTTVMVAVIERIVTEGYWA